MATSCLNVQPFFAKPQAFSCPYHLQLLNTTAITTNRHFQSQIHPCHISPLPLRSREYCVRVMPRLGLGSCEPDQRNLANSVGSLIWLFRSFAPGGDWWKLRDSTELGDRKGKSATVPSALWRIWLLLSDDRGIIISAFASLAIAALSEISMPSLLVASIFAVNKAESVVFYRNCRMLALLCLTSGIFSGLRGGCFAIANSIYVKRLRETLYHILLYQSQLDV